MRIAADLGFGFVKAKNEDGKKVRFPSIIVKRPENSLRKFIGGASDDYSITYSEDNNKLVQQHFYVGDEAMTNGGTRRWKDKDQFNINELKIFIATAVGLVNPEEEEVDLCVGLPMSYFLQKKDELIEALKTVEGNISYEGASTKRIKFRSVFCFPQGAGAYYASVYNTDGTIKDYQLASSSVGVVDVGYRTIDFLAMVKGRKGIVMRDDLSGSLEEDGMNKVYQEIESRVSEKVGREVGLIKIEQAILWFGGKLDYRGKTIDLTEIEEKIYKEHAEKVSSRIKLKWGSEEALLSKILIAGGGGDDLYKTFDKEFEQSELQKDAAFANCDGYLGAQAKLMSMKK